MAFQPEAAVFPLTQRCRVCPAPGLLARADWSAVAAHWGACCQAISLGAAELACLQALLTPPQLLKLDAFMSGPALINFVT